MGIFSGIIGGIRDTIDNMIDTSINIIGNITDLVRHIEPTDIEPIGTTAFDRQQDSDFFNDLYSDYIDWINIGIDS